MQFDLASPALQAWRTQSRDLPNSGSLLGFTVEGGFVLQAIIVPETAHQRTVRPIVEDPAHIFRDAVLLVRFVQSFRSCHFLDDAVERITALIRAKLPSGFLEPLPVRLEALLLRALVNRERFVALIPSP